MMMTGHGSGAGDGVGGYLEGKTTRSWLLIGNIRKNTNYYYFVVRLFNFERWLSLGLVLDRYVCDALISSKGGCLNITYILWNTMKSLKMVLKQNVS